MPYYLRFMSYNRWPSPSYKPLGTDSRLNTLPTYEQGKVYRLRLVSSTDEVATWPEFVVVSPPRQRLINDPDHPGQSATLVEIFVVLLSKYELFVEPFQNWELN